MNLDGEGVEVVEDDVGGLDEDGWVALECGTMKLCGRVANTSKYFSSFCRTPKQSHKFTNVNTPLRSPVVGIC